MNKDLGRILMPGYSVDSIENFMSLRKPQKRSLSILESILNELDFQKGLDLESVKNAIHDVYPIFTDFEHPFLSLTFALATGVGKTKLMGAFMAYLYANKGVRNFFVVAPSITIYDKLKNDLGNPSPDNEKYVFKGIGCLAAQKPNVWFDDDYRNRPESALTDSNSINIFIFNISKFNSEGRKMMSINEYLGQSFFDFLKSLDDLVLIMDESHHYRAKSSIEAINSLNPLLGLELTATPKVQDGSKNANFKNVVYEYPLSSAIRDGYTRSPYALTRRDIKTYNFSDEELDKVMLADGTKHHEIMKATLLEYSKNNSLRIVKPFLLVVCQDTAHAESIYTYLESLSFFNGKYKGKVVIVHSNQSGEEKEENINLLLSVEKADNPIEIVVHVNKLKEGWDVNNLYTIVPLRTATSKVLREQTIGRGLRLPYGYRTGNDLVDSVTITAHDKFEEIIKEANEQDSIFKTGGIIYAEQEKEKKLKESQGSLFETSEEKREIIEQAGVDHNDPTIQQVYVKIESAIREAISGTSTEKRPTASVQERAMEIFKSDVGERYRDNTDVTHLLEVAFGIENIEKKIDKVNKYQMFIPKLKTIQQGAEKYIIVPFDLDLSELVYVPIKDDILIKNILDSHKEAIVIKGTSIDYDSFNPLQRLIELIRFAGEIDYEKCPELIQKVVTQFANHYLKKYTKEEFKNIVLFNQKDISSKIKDQLIAHLSVTYDGLVEIVSSIETAIITRQYDISNGLTDLWETAIDKNNIKSMLFEGAKKATSSLFKFDSDSERIFAQMCENSPEVIQWLRPDPRQFDIYYNRGQRYEPDFVIETEDSYYLVEVKARKDMNNADVLAKKERGISYCKVASEFNKANGNKPFEYLLVPHDEFSPSSSFDNIKDRFKSF